MTADETVPTRKNFSAASGAGVLVLEEAGQEVQRDRHQLERDEQQDQVARRREHEHAEQRGEQREVILGRPAGRSARRRQRRATRARSAPPTRGTAASRRAPVRPPGRNRPVRTPPGPTHQDAEKIPTRPRQREPAREPVGATRPNQAEHQHGHEQGKDADLEHERRSISACAMGFTTAPPVASGAARSPCRSAPTAMPARRRTARARTRA